MGAVETQSPSHEPSSFVFVLGSTLDSLASILPCLPTCVGGVLVWGGEDDLVIGESPFVVGRHFCCDYRRLAQSVNLAPSPPSTPTLSSPFSPSAQGRSIYLYHICHPAPVDLLRSPEAGDLSVLVARGSVLGGLYFHFLRAFCRFCVDRLSFRDLTRCRRRRLRRGLSVSDWAAYPHSAPHPQIHLFNHFSARF